MDATWVMRRRRTFAPQNMAEGSGGLPQIMTDVTVCYVHSKLIPGIHLSSVATSRKSYRDRACIQGSQPQKIALSHFKSTECPVCPILLRRLSFLSGNPIWDSDAQQDIYVQHFRDPFYGNVTTLPVEGFQQAARLVLFTDATYIILCPGDQHKLIGIAQSGGKTWKDFPFIADSRELTITTNLLSNQNMRFDSGEAIPAILEYDGANHVVHFGRA